MTAFGRFEAVREISQTGLGTVWTAREAGLSAQTLSASAMLRSTFTPGEQFVIKLFQPLGFLPGDRHFDAEIDEFLRRARAQQDLVRKGAKHWARVHALGRFDEGAYAVIDAHPRSAQQLILRKVDLWRTSDPRDPGSILRGLIQGVVEALQEMARHAAGRGHGALKPSNVLLAGDGSVLSARPVLTDPLPDPGPDDHDRRLAYTRRDRRDLGALIYQLIVQRPFRELAAWPIEDSPEWRAFGRRGGARWLDLTNRLLDPRASASPPTLDEIAAELAAWPVEPPSRKVPIAIGLSLLLVVGGAGVWYATRPPPRPVLVLAGGQLDQLKDDINWIDALAPIAGDPAIEDAARGDPGLAAIVAPVREYTQADSLSRAIKYLRYERAKGDLEPTERSVKAGVSDLWRVYEPVTTALAAWPAPARLDEAAKAFEARGWPGAGRALGDARAAYDAILASRPSQQAAGADARPEEPRPVEAIRGVLNAARLSVDLQAAWKPIADLAAALAQNEDAILKLAPAAFEGRARAASESEKPLDALHHELDDLARLGEQIEAARRAHYAKADLEYFAELSQVHQKLRELGGAPTPDQAIELLKAWPAEIAEPRFIREPIGDVWAGRAVDTEVAQAAADMEKLIAKRRPGDEARLDPMGEHLKTAQQQLAVLQKKLEAPKRREYDAIRADAKTLLAGLDTLKAEIADLKELRLQEFEAYLPNFRKRTLESGSPALDAEFIRARDAIDQKHSAAKEIADLRDRADRVAKVLAALNTLPQAEGLSGPAAQVAMARREAVLAGAIAKLPRDEEGLFPAGAAAAEAFAGYWKKETEAYNGWLESARAGLAEADAIANLIADGYGPAHQTASGTLADRWAKLAGQHADLLKEGSLGAPGQRLAAMSQIASLRDPAALAQVITAPEAGLAEAITAWMTLRTLNWPASVADLAAARDLLARHVAPLAESARTDQRRAEIKAWAAQEQRQTWLAAFEALKPEAAEVDAAVALMADYGVDEPTLERLTPQARYNILLARLRADLPASASLPDDAVRERLRRFEADAARIGVASPASDALRAALRDLVNAPPKKEVDLATVGPGAAGWAKGDAAPDGAWVVYTPPGGGNGSLRFWRVTDGQTPGGPPAAYLCETETSLAMFTTILEAGRGGQDVVKLLSRLDADPDPRRGPSAWGFIRREARAPGKPPIELRAPDTRRVGQGWLNVVAGMDRGEPYYPEGLQVAPPSPESPMNYLPATAAIYAARLAGCRLPTPAEWAAAAAMNQGGTANVRDKPWKDQHAFIAAQRQAGKVNAPWPDEDIFVPDERKAQIQPRRRQAALPVTDQPADGALWFMPVTATGHGEPFKHLRGNVAELLYENSGQLDGLTPAAVTTTPSSGWEGLKVAGGSALSPSEVDPDTAYRGGSANAWYSDVGFRLAFSAGEGKPKPLIVLARQVIGPAPYLPAR